MAVRNTIIFTVGRMNPPTSGHMKLIQTMMEANLELHPSDLGHGHVYIILSHTKDNTKNPLTCERKKSLLIANGMIQYIKTNQNHLSGITVNVLCTEEKEDSGEPHGCGTRFIISQLCRIIKSEEKLQRTITNAELILGSDRQDNFRFITEYLSDKHITFNEIGHDGRRLFEKYNAALERNLDYIVDDTDSPIDPVNMSGTLVRSLVKKNQESRFVKLYENAGLSREDATSLFRELVHELSIVERKSKKSKATKSRSPSPLPAPNPKKSKATKSRSPSPSPSTKQHYRKTRRAPATGTLGGGKRSSKTKHTHTRKMSHTKRHTKRR